MGKNRRNITMNIEKALEELGRERNRINEMEEFVKSSPSILKHINWMGGKTFWSKSLLWEEAKAHLTELRRDGFILTLFNYWMSCGHLCVNYKIFGTKYEVSLRVTDYEKALESLGKGKCKVVEQTVARQEVVCEI